MHKPLPKYCACLFACLGLALPLIAPAQTNASAANPTPAAPSPSRDIVELHDVVFGRGGDRDLHAEIAYPKDAPGPLPAVIFIHGGGWIGGSHKNSPITQLAHAGYFGASIEYRLSNVAKWPAQIQDCKLGVRWLRVNAAKYNVDPNRIGVWGESAGGQLVACLGTMADRKEYEGDGGYPGVSSAVQAVVDFFGPTDLTRPDIYSPFAIKCSELLFGATLQDKPGVWKSGSPFYNVKAGDPPMLIVQGDSDTTVPMAQSTIFDEALTKAGVPHQLLIVKNAEHGLGPLPGKTIDPSRDDIQKAVYAFLDKYLKSP
jgi:acetyl esterase/lipase